MPGTTTKIKIKPVTVTDSVAQALEHVTQANHLLRDVDLRRTRGPLRDDLREGRTRVAELSDLLIQALQNEAAEARAS